MLEQKTKLSKLKLLNGIDYLFTGKIPLKYSQNNKKATFVTGSEFSSYEIKLRSQVKQNDVTLQVTNSKFFIEILFWSYELDFIKY